jgi:hypothetical protein
MNSWEAGIAENQRYLAIFEKREKITPYEI